MRRRIRSGRLRRLDYLASRSPRSNRRASDLNGQLSLAIQFALRDIRRTGWWTLRQFVYLSILIAVLFMVLALPQSIYFASVGADDYARYDIRLNGAIDTGKVKRLLALPDIESVAFTNAFIPREIRSDGGSSSVRNGWVFDGNEELDHLWNTPELLIDGGTLTNGVGLDWSLARALRVGIGSKVDITWTTDRDSFTLKTPVQAIYAPTGPLQSAIVTLNRGQTKAFFDEYLQSISVDQATPFAYSDAFIDSSQPRETQLEIRRVFAENPGSVQIRTKDMSRALAIEEAEHSLPSKWRNILTACFVIGAVIILAREQRARLERRQLHVAVLSALGASQRWLYLLHLTETLVIGSVATVIAMLSSRSALTMWLRIYVPPSASLTAVLQAIAVLIILAIWGIFRTRRLIKQVPISRLLATEAAQA
jgi:hypothetical protein